MWTIFGYLLSGLIFWGGAGYAADRWLGTGYLTLTGLLVGMGGGHLFSLATVRPRIAVRRI